VLLRRCRALDLWPLARRSRAAAPRAGRAQRSAAELRDRLVATLLSVQIVTIPGATHFAALERRAKSSRDRELSAASR
jgi:hypothetical protein